MPPSTRSRPAGAVPRSGTGCRAPSPQIPWALSVVLEHKKHPVTRVTSAACGPGHSARAPLCTIPSAPPQTDTRPHYTRPPQPLPRAPCPPVCLGIRLPQGPHTHTVAWCWSASVWLVSLNTTSPRCIHGGAGSERPSFLSHVLLPRPPLRGGWHFSTLLAHLLTPPWRCSVGEGPPGGDRSRAGGRLGGISWEARRGLGGQTRNLGGDRPARLWCVCALPGRTGAQASVTSCLCARSGTRPRATACLRSRVWRREREFTPQQVSASERSGSWQAHRVILSLAGSFLTLLATPVTVCAEARLGSACGFSSCPLQSSFICSGVCAGPVTA